MRNYIKDKRKRAIIALIVLLVVNAKKLRFCGCNLSFDERYYKRDKDGRFAKCASVEQIKPHIERYNALVKEHNGNYAEAAHAYYKEFFQDKVLSAKTPQGDIEISFNGNGWRHIKANTNNDPVKAELIPYIPFIIQNGQYVQNDLYKEHGSIIGFHTWQMKVQTSEGIKDVLVDVAQHDEKSLPPYLAYGVTREGGYGYEKRMSEIQKKEHSTGCIGLNPAQSNAHQSKKIVTNVAVDKKKIANSFEVVNIRFAA